MGSHQKYIGTTSDIHSDTLAQTRRIEVSIVMFFINPCMFQNSFEALVQFLSMGKTLQYVRDTIFRLFVNEKIFIA